MNREEFEAELQKLIENKDTQKKLKSEEAELKDHLCGYMSSHNLGEYTYGTYLLEKVTNYEYQYPTPTRLREILGKSA